MGDRVRVLLEYQYDNQQATAVETLKFIDEYFYNGDGLPHVADPHPISYYVWGAGAPAYFGASNPRGLGVSVTGGLLEAVPIPAGTSKVAPRGTGWTFTGTAGIYRNLPNTAANTPIDVPNLGRVPAPYQGNQAMFLSGNATAQVPVTFPKAGVFAIDFRAAAKAGGLGNSLDFYLNDVRVTPNGRDLKPPPYAWWVGNGNRDANRFSPYGTIPIQVPRAGRYTFKIVGRGTADQTTVIDDVRVASADAIFASKIPTGVQAAGQVTQFDMWAHLATEAAWTRAYGLKFVAYEGGWSLGGDNEMVPLQSWVKYKDPRAGWAMASAIDAFHRADGEVYVLGAYDQWHLDDAAHANDYALVKGMDNRLAMLPAAPMAKTVIRGPGPVTLKSTTALQALSIPTNAAPGDWMNWTFQVTVAGLYKVTSMGGDGGPAVIYADGTEVGRGAVNGTSGFARFTAGVHTIRVQSAGGWFLIQGITMVRVGEIPVP
jgi:hypothetical protein